MGADFSVFYGTVGHLKMGSLCVGALTVVFTAMSYMNMEQEPKEVSYLIIVILVFIISIFWLFFYGIALCLLTDESIVRKIDMILHIVMGLFVVPSAIAWFVSVYEYEERDSEKESSSIEHLIQRIIAGLLGFGLGIMCLVMGYLIWKNYLRYL